MQYVFGFDKTDDYILQSMDFPIKNLALEKKTVRFFEPKVIKKKSDTVINEIKIVETAGNLFHIVFANGRYMCRDGRKGYGVISCDENGKNKEWYYVNDDTGVGEIKIDDECLTVHTFDERFNGHYAQIRTCNNQIHQKFKLKKLDAKKNPTEEQINKIEEVKKASVENTDFKDTKTLENTDNTSKPQNILDIEKPKQHTADICVTKPQRRI
ncbi:hypothetical protein COBT_000116 [Conglomerata obtusa]